MSWRVHREVMLRVLTDELNAACERLGSSAARFWFSNRIYLPLAKMGPA